MHYIHIHIRIASHRIASILSCHVGPESTGSVCCETPLSLKAGTCASRALFAATDIHGSLTLLLLGSNASDLEERKTANRFSRYLYTRKHHNANTLVLTYLYCMCTLDNSIP